MVIPFAMPIIHTIIILFSQQILLIFLYEVYYNQLIFLPVLVRPTIENFLQKGFPDQKYPQTASGNNFEDNTCRVTKMLPGHQ